jgi:hypothetical protein
LASKLPSIIIVIIGTVGLICLATLKKIEL